MLCSSGRCRAASVVAIVWSVVLSVASGAPGLVFGGGSGIEATVFAVGDGRRVVGVGIGGKRLDAAVLTGVPFKPAGRRCDEVSRLVVFEMPEALPDAFHLAVRAPDGGLLSTPDGATGGRIESRVEKIGGKYLPFTLLGLRYDASPPRPGTPLLDAEGRVAAVAFEGRNGNFGYALPVEVVARVLDLLREGGEVRRAWLGLTLNPGSDAPKVVRTVPESPANRAGVLPGDVLTEIGGIGVSDYGDAVNAMFLLRPGKATSLKVRRGNGSRTLELVPAVAGK